VTAVGIFDSGIGGLSVWRQIVRRSPELDTHYVADQSHLPYGTQPHDHVLTYSREITRFLVRRGCGVVVVACNTASAVALQALRSEFDAVRFVGMEPAVKPAAALSRNKIVAVWATPATLQGALFERTLARLDADVHILRQPCPGLVEAIEADDTGRLESLLTDLLRAPREAGADTLVLACTHYPLVRDTIERLAGTHVHVVDPAAAVARQVASVAAAMSVGDAEQSPHAAQHTLYTTGDADAFAQQTQRWLNVDAGARALVWSGTTLAPHPEQPTSPAALPRETPRP